MSVFLCFIFLFPFLLIFLKNLKPSKWNLPPGPKKLPIIAKLQKIKGTLHLSLRDFSQQYGPVMYFRFGFVPTVVITSKEAAEEVLKIHDLECCSRSVPLGIQTVTYNCKDIGFAPYGEEWRVMRKLSVVELFSTKKLQSFTHIREQENDLLVKKLAEIALRRSPVNLRTTLYTFVGSIVCRIGFGQNLHDCEFMDEDSITDLLYKVSLINQIFMFSDFFPGRIGRFIDWISGKNKRLKNAFSEPDTFFQNILDEHLKPERREVESPNIIDVMVDLMKKPEKDGEDSFKLNTDHIKAMISDILLAGIGTSVDTILWTMTELIKNPKVMKKVQDEIRATLGDKKERITEEDLTNLHYLKLVAKETLRLHPPFPVLLPRETLSQVKIQGFDIPAKTQIMINVYALARDPKHWSNPDEFNPDRFLDSCIDYKGLNFELLPFGSGRRICPGMGLGITLTELGLLNLLYFFDWGLPEKQETDKINTDNEASLHLFQVVRH